MTSPDPLSARMFRNQIVRHQAGANSEFANIQRRIASLGEDIQHGNVTTALGSARNLAREVADLVSRLAALETLNDVECLVARQDAGEPSIAESTKEKP
ncbi:hypothetical protein ACGFNU_20940 [Spirillospora sp. NPDC048911]|uniref:hypothetical protein n=1 Tax=Spirillospora sp. NPDC048911 TaxID=3364527 RepID=UPI00371EA046